MRTAISNQRLVVSREAEQSAKTKSPREKLTAKAAKNAKIFKRFFLAPFACLAVRKDVTT